jgi:hypothetical protein
MGIWLLVGFYDVFSIYGEGCSRIVRALKGGEVEEYGG